MRPACSGLRSVRPPKRSSLFAIRCRPLSLHMKRRAGCLRRAVCCPRERREVLRARSARPRVRPRGNRSHGLFRRLSALLGELPSAAGDEQREHRAHAPGRGVRGRTLYRASPTDFRPLRHCRVSIEPFQVQERSAHPNRLEKAEPSCAGWRAVGESRWDFPSRRSTLHADYSYDATRRSRRSTSATAIAIFSSPVRSPGSSRT